MSKQQQSEPPAQEPQGQEGPPPASGGKKKQKLTIAKAIVHIKATFNNTIITLTDRNGNTLVCGSSGAVGYKGDRKSVV